ncbi:hypothetical protein SCAR479_00660 [Seiridium cardinale]|uniref:Uncharacterized protein n=1 Tax=Seiridium cardinale TaxID=138064 RepID=A0ABR2YAR9_9PEZI
MVPPWQTGHQTLEVDAADYRVIPYSAIWRGRHVLAKALERGDVCILLSPSVCLALKSPLLATRSDETAAHRTCQLIKCLNDEQRFPDIQGRLKRGMQEKAYFVDQAPGPGWLLGFLGANLWHGGHSKPLKVGSGSDGLAEADLAVSCNQRRVGEESVSAGLGLLAHVQSHGLVATALAPYIRQR